MTTELVLLGTAGAPTPVAGYDNTTIACIAPINLTSVDQAGPGHGATAARLLTERMDGRSRSVLTSAAPQLIVRSTTAPPWPQPEGAATAVVQRADG
jgi:DNA-binding LacI/PurR family transcriptional regulator